MITACCEENIDQQSSAHYMDLLCRKQFRVKLKMLFSTLCKTLFYVSMYPYRKIKLND